jgi:glycosyltransferase involved in cell wall biosynthesis
VSQRKLKILYLITKSNWGGAQRYVYDLATALDKNKFDVTVALGGTGKLCDELSRAGVPLIRLKNFERDISIVKDLRAAHELWQILRAEKPDILHINSSKAGGLGALLGRLAHIPTIIFTAHGWAFNEDRPPLIRLFIRILHITTILLAHRTIAVSNQIKEQISLPYLDKKMIVIHNGRTLQSLADRSAARATIIAHAPTLKDCIDDRWGVTIAELHPVKRHEVLIHAVARVIQKHPTYRHVIIGSGEREAELKSLVSALGLEKHVYFTGPILEAAQLLRAFDIFVLSSRSEALAYVIIEACIARMPIVASNVGGIPEIIKNSQSGILCAEGDVEAFAQAMVQILDNTQLRNALADAAKERANSFSFESMLGSTERVYESTISRAT